MLEFLWNILEILFFTKGRLFQKELLEFLIWANPSPQGAIVGCIGHVHAVSGSCRFLCGRIVVLTFLLSVRSF